MKFRLTMAILAVASMITGYSFGGGSTKMGCVLLLVSVFCFASMLGYCLKARMGGEDDDR